MTVQKMLRRTILYSSATPCVSRTTCLQALVSGASQKYLDKSLEVTVDCFAYDLEDSVTPSRKVEARKLVRRVIDQLIPSDIMGRAVRINSVAFGLAVPDLKELVSSPNSMPILVPKVDSASDLIGTIDAIAHLRAKDQSNPPPIYILALI